MNIENLVIPFGVFAAVIGGLVKLLLLQHQKRMDERFDTLTTKRDEQDRAIAAIVRDLAGHNARLGQLETVMKYLPSHSDMTEVKSKLAGLEAETRNQTDMLGALGKQVGLINEWLINRAK
jgi:uncharacterized coiled-coil protein SlyX